jgi:hypothetical protein
MNTVSSLLHIIRTLKADRGNSIATHAHEGERGISALHIPFTNPSCEVSNDLKVSEKQNPDYSMVLRQ